MMSLFVAASELVQNIKNSLQIFWKGMLAIVIVIALIYGATLALTQFSNKAIEKKKAEQNAQNNEEQK